MPNFEHDNSAISIYRTCHQKFAYRMVNGLVLKGGSAGAAFGTTLHAGREAYRKAILGGVQHSDAVEQAVLAVTATWQAEMPAAYANPAMATDRRSQASAVHLLRGYLAKFGNQYYTPVHIEVPFAIHAGQSRLFPGTDIIYTGIIDEICRFNNSLYVLDLKSCGTIFGPNPEWFKQFRTSSQCKGYVRAAEETIGEKVAGVIIHAIWVKNLPGPKSKTKFEDYFRGDVFCYSTSQLDEWQDKFCQAVDEVERAKLEAPTKGWDMQSDSACMLYGGCPYNGLCASPPETRPQLIKMDYEVKPWVPLKDKRALDAEA